MVLNKNSRHFYTFQYIFMSLFFKSSMYQHYKFLSIGMPFLFVTIKLKKMKFYKTGSLLFPNLELRIPIPA